jgi:hypothetical protein
MLWWLSNDAFSAAAASGGSYPASGVQGCCSLLFEKRLKCQIKEIAC